MRIDLRISARFRLLLLLYVALALSMTATSIVACGVVLDSGNLTDSLAALFGVLFSVLCLVGGIRRLTRPQGMIDIRPEGVSFLCYSLGPYSGIFGGYTAAGFAEWSNLSTTGLVKAQGRQCLGICFRDPDAFAASKAKLKESERLYVDRFGQQSMRILRALGPSFPVVGQFLELCMTLLGFTGLPKSAEEKDIWAWNKENYGWNLLIPDVIIPNGPESVRLVLEQHRPAANAT